MSETSIPWLENAAFGIESCLPLTTAERITLRSVGESTVVSNADCYLDWLLFLAPRIEAYIEKFKIKGNREHERVLERFVQWCNRLCDVSQLSLSRHSELRGAYLRSRKLLESK